MADFEDLDPVLDRWSDIKNMLIPYRTLIDVSFLRKMAYNTSYNYGRLQEVILANELIPYRTAKDYDTDKSWTNAYVQMVLDFSDAGSLPLPYDLGRLGNEVVYTQFTSEYQTWRGLRYKYLSTGGFRLFHIFSPGIRITGAIIKMRRIVGVEVTA